MARIGNRMGVWLYVRSAGRLAGGADKVLLLTVPGRRSGQPRSSCMRYLSTDDGLMVWGTASGAPRDPDWFRNLRVAEMADVQVGRDTFRVRPRELLGAERDTAWRDTVLVRAPEVTRYADKAGRTIPVAVLERI
jgi:deazaflavin-dependent oxidoreductase (nitroreductase family)